MLDSHSSQASLHTCIHTLVIHTYIHNIRIHYIYYIYEYSPELVAAAPGGKPVFGTNPLAVGIPTSIDGTTPPFTFDMATSAIALFGVLTAKAQNQPLPYGVAYDKHGHYTTDASAVLEDGGAIATFGEHKGTGLSLCVELLAGALSGSAVLGQVPSKKTAMSWGHTFIAINPKMLVDEYEEKVTSIVDTVRSSGTAVRIPGERSTKTSIDRQRAGQMPIPTKIWESILRTAEHGLQQPNQT
jgi:LDH2 family malate/lactate/ureidoglycolate dehydrogenase